jgi:hypothetical protein
MYHLETTQYLSAVSIHLGWTFMHDVAACAVQSVCLLELFKETKTNTGFFEYSFGFCNTVFHLRFPPLGKPTVWGRSLYRSASACEIR